MWWLGLVLVGAAMLSVMVFAAAMIVVVAGLALMGDDVATAIIDGNVTLRVRFVHVTLVRQDWGPRVAEPAPEVVEELPSRRRHSAELEAEQARVRDWEYRKRRDVYGGAALRRATLRGDRSQVDQILGRSTAPDTWGEVRAEPDYPPEYPRGQARVRRELAKIRRR